ncbi:UNVERIFIED_CONTAM: hypothetical protein HDU68_000597 [Siphonaria sp. JEL0065]|nr:hypothetical protein HDU68_000597 [Siphonaria sp. JEL0065]
MKKLRLEPTLATHELLLRSMLSIRPLDFKAIRKARSKLVVGNKGSKMWSLGEFEATLEAIAEVGTMQDVEKTLAIMKSKKIPITRSVSDSLMKFYSLNGNPEKVIQLYKQIKPTSNASPTFTTYASLLHSIAALPEHYPLLQETPSKILESLKSPTSKLGPATFDLLIVTLLTLRDLPDVQKTFQEFVDVVVPIWKAEKLFGFSNDGPGTIILSKDVLEAMCSVYGVSHDAPGMVHFFKEFMGKRSVLEFYRNREAGHVVEEKEADSAHGYEGELGVGDSAGSPFESCYKAFAIEWLGADGDEAELERVLVRLKELEMLE